MGEPVYIWELTIPQKIEYKLWQALLLLGIDIHDDYKVWFSDYMVTEKIGFKGYYADVIITATDLEITALYHMLEELKAYDVDILILDELCEEEDK